MSVMATLSKSSSKPKSSANKIAWLFLALPIGCLAVFFFGPLLAAGWMSLLDYSQSLEKPTFLGLGNYTRLLQTPAFLQAVWQTGLFWLAIVPAMVVLPLALALFLNRAVFGVGAIRTVLYLPVVTSLVVVGLAWKWLYAKDGLINAGLATVGLPSVDWLTDPNIAWLAISLVVIWKGAAYYMMMILAHLQSLNSELLQAAELDGASPWQRHWHVTIPHLAPMVAFVMVMSTIGTLKMFTEIYVLTGGGPLGSTQTWVYYLYEAAFGHLELGLACAAGILLMWVLVAISWGQLRLLGEADHA